MGMYRGMDPGHPQQRQKTGCPEHRRHKTHKVIWEGKKISHNADPRACRCLGGQFRKPIYLKFR